MKKPKLKPITNKTKFSNLEFKEIGGIPVVKFPKFFLDNITMQERQRAMDWVSDLKVSGEHPTKHEVRSIIKAELQRAREKMKNARFFEPTFVYHSDEIKSFFKKLSETGSRLIPSDYYLAKKRKFKQ